MYPETEKPVLSDICTVRSIRGRGAICELQLNMPRDFPEPAPGQFLLISPKPALERNYIPYDVKSPDFLPRFDLGPTGDRPMLMRPMSIFEYVRPEGRLNGLLTLLFKVVGAGTFLLSEVKPGCPLGFLGPLGKGFPSLEFEHVVLVAGGVGISGLNRLCTSLAAKARAPLFVLGVNDREQSPVKLAMTEVSPIHKWSLPSDTESLRLVVSHLFDSFIPSMVASMYPGDQGAFCGTACDLVEGLFRANPERAKETSLVACGPDVMLASLADVARHHDIQEYLVALESKMACGVGTCLGCAVQIRDPGAETGPASYHYERVCKDGPVFDGYRVVYKR